MQPHKFDDILRRVAEKKNLSEENKEVLKSIGMHVFTQAKREMSLFRDLSIIIPGLIIIYYGKKRMEGFLERLDRPTSKVAFIESKGEGFKEEIKLKIQYLLERYEVYIQDKKITKQAYREAKQKN